MRRSITAVFCGTPMLLMALLCSGVPVSHAQEEGVNAKKLFIYHCATCHGEDGKGTKRGHELKSPNLTDADWQAKKNDDEILNSITNGKNKMPRWNEKLKPEEIQSLARYVRKLAIKKKS